MTGEPDQSVTLAFVGYADRSTAARAIEYEDRVLPLLADHGGRVLFRGRRRTGEDESLPLEVHVLWFPSRSGLDAYLADDRRQRLLEEHGPVFALKQTVEIDVVETSAG